MDALRLWNAVTGKPGNEVLVVPGRIGKRKKPSTIQDLASGKIVRR